jgi:acyl dehydratase
MGRFYEQFETGQRFETPRRTITEADIVAFAGLTADFNPLHVDEVFASATEFGGRIAHGPMVIGMAFGLASRIGLFDGTALGLLTAEWEFHKPVRAGDTLCADVTVVEKRLTKKTDRGVIELRFEIRNQSGTVVQTGAAKILVRRSGLEDATSH